MESTAGPVDATEQTYLLTLTMQSLVWILNHGDNAIHEILKNKIERILRSLEILSHQINCQMQQMISQQMISLLILLLSTYSKDF